MSNYFTSLFDRYQQETPVIKPRLPSLFESDSSADRLAGVTTSTRGFGDEATVEEIFAESPHLGLPKPLRVNRQEPAWVDSPVHEEKPEQERRESPLPVRAQPRQSVPRMDTPPQPQALMQASSSLPTFGSAPKLPVSSPVTVRETTASLGNVADQDAGKGTLRQRFVQDSHRPVAPVMPAVASPAKLDTPTNTGKPGSLQQQEQVLAPKTVRLEQKRLPTELTGVMTQPVVPTFAMPEKPAPQPEPVINVTIGRIEVRATPAAAPKSAKPHSAPATMTLDDYLRQRNKGERR
jgi:hypothetical protein